MQTETSRKPPTHSIVIVAVLMAAVGMTGTRDRGKRV
jgi:hypothetical protein